MGVVEGGPGCIFVMFEVGVGGFEAMAVEEVSGVCSFLVSFTKAELA